MDNRLRLQYLFETIQRANNFLRLPAFKAEDPQTIELRDSANIITKDIIELLEKEDHIEKGVDPDENTYLHLAASANSLAIMTYLIIARKFDCNKANSNGETALHMLCRKNKEYRLSQVLEFLLQQPTVDIKLKDKFQKTAIEKAISTCDKKAIHLILKYKKLDKSSFFNLCRQTLGSSFPFLVSILLKYQHQYHPSLAKMRHHLRDIANLAAKKGHINIIEAIKKINIAAISPPSIAFKLLQHENKKNISQTTSSMNLIKSEYPTYAPYQSPILKYEHAKLILAAKKSRYKANKIIVLFAPDKNNSSSEEEFKKFLVGLEEANSPNFNIRLQFIMTGSHWISGDIQIINGNVRVLFIDSLGNSDFGSWRKLLISDHIKIVRKYFPKADVFCNIEQLQRSDYNSCTLFAIDNALHLQNADDFIIKSEDQKDLYDYLLKHQYCSKPFSTKDQIAGSIYFVSLPLRLIRSMQSLNTKPIPELPHLLQKVGIFSRIEMADKVEADHPVNKKGEKALVSVKHHLGKMAKKKINIRIQYKLDRMRKNVLSYMLTHSREDIAHDVQKLDLNNIISGFTISK